MSWDDKRVETLKRMWADGHSASQIAKELGDVTRNAVIGKVHRLGLSNRDLKDAPAEPEAEAPLPPLAAAAAEEVDDLDVDEPALDLPEPEEPDEEEDEDDDEPPVPIRRAIIPAGQPLPPQPNPNEISPEALAKVTEVEKVARRLTLMELTEKTCKWPVGDPATSNFWFCGLGVQVGKPYCEAHVGVAFQPMSARRDRRR